jgi:hypothetical protein
MSVNLDSTAVFQARCKEIKLNDTVYDALVLRGFATYAGLAYCLSFIPGGNGDETPFVVTMKAGTQRVLNWEL